jgi:hypothetical protein
MRGVFGRLKAPEEVIKTHRINQTRSCQVKIQARTRQQPFRQGDEVAVIVYISRSYACHVRQSGRSSQVMPKSSVVSDLACCGFILVGQRLECRTADAGIPFICVNPTNSAQACSGEAGLSQKNGRHACLPVLIVLWSLIET